MKCISGLKLEGLLSKMQLFGYLDGTKLVQGKITNTTPVNDFRI